ncbi:histidine triad nucleotide-binding protein [Candidatus Giovannonibacteria bacterium RIFCSPLOWO2_12_FULL_44_25]|uniref:Histidine triad nucleotide-binding protein n=1 Tax=Candidatus Giovannonibacteria bacterium RIFCSPHIGHO2_02_FULL_45_40 TaxID=1798337 RepID=A0A1F5WA15_9BACT|nr:MAG: histidine triad nucleotide-binding protein [Candidatus Giovannonibacteria bacterium GWA2_45_15]OGF59139.1 MAG: histidine triad nucleotide-binding protein [Candidatus Giovannonibacteria bacterium RIFCSPHIGHO2_01_45_12]OGF60180.1 MAG: histidine triad nucleotide-binding protein [Candidatus Giovannonibacteria bacterium RIFCSPHIGHO2_01_FULL_44_100]OGF72400.1 MAG: histidine triad nucleotide-binding protein [Candidatus Giovannonibacteria bacterium RIFCSPHIGHO2_02_FULL_45_40]OGF83450.1 MAG: his
MDDCVFCKIIKKEIPAEILQETEDFVIFKDIKPSAPVHYLAVLKKHIPSIKEIEHEDEALIGHLIHEAKSAAEKLGLSGYKLVFNVGRDGGQIIDHIHLHILGGWN